MILKNNINTFWSSILIEELIRCGVGQFFISPGSRSTPLTVSVAKNAKAKSKIVFDERSAAFQALGYSKASGVPAVLICTSGSASANYFPAVIEAERSNIPLIIISADRPPELQDTGSNQTFNQQGLFGDHVVKFMNLVTPDPNIDPGTILSKIDDLFFKAIDRRGPVHLNCMFREPLAPTDQKFKLIKELPTEWENSSELFTHIHKEDNSIDPILVAEDFRNKKTIVILGDVGNNYIEIPELNVPVFRDIQSNIICENNSTIFYYDQVLMLDQIDRLKPEKVIVIGRNLISKRLLKFIENTDITSFTDCDHKYDPGFRVKTKIITEYIDAANVISNIYSNDTYLSRWKKLDKKVEKVVSSMKDEVDFSEFYVSQKLQENMKYGVFYLASSMPIRLMDMYFKPSIGQVFLSNRGVSGIDGIMSSAIGASEYLEREIYLIIGDLAFYHDLNAILTLKNSKARLKIILINNKGGGIFRFLPISKSKDVFEDYFVTPHDFEFTNIVKQIFDNVNQVSSKEDFDDAFESFNHGSESAIIEILLNNELNYKQYQIVQNKIKEIKVD